MVQELVNQEKNIFRAELLIHTAIDLYNDNNFLCSVLLAAAAEGSLGQQLKRHNIQHSLSVLKEKLKNEYPENEFDLNAYSNSLKHASEYPYNENEENTRLESLHFLSRSISNYLSITKNITDKMKLFFNNSILPLAEENVA